MSQPEPLVAETPPVATMTDALATRLFPVVLLLCNVGAAVLAFSHGDRQRGLYWLASAVCIACVAW